MLKFVNGKCNGGFVLWGSYETLKQLHSFILDISERSTVLEYEGLIPGLAYDLRKAYEGQRQKGRTKVWDDAISIYGVEQIWPTFLVQVALLRTGLAFVDSSKHEQSTMYLLEGFVEDAVNGCFSDGSYSILASYKSLVGIQEPFIRDIIGSRVAYFLAQDTSKRQKILAEILLSLRSMWEINHNIFGIERMGGSLTPEDFKDLTWDNVDESCDI